MRVTRIEPYENGRFSKIYLDGAYALSLSNEVIQKHGVAVGADVDVAGLQELETAALVRRARERLLYALDRRLHSERELRDKLRRDYPPQVIDAAIDALAELGLIDDLKFARTYAEQQLRLHRRGPFAIRALLYQKGVDRAVVDCVLEELFEQEDSELNAALQAAQKYAAQLDTPQGRRRAYAFLARRGFSARTVRTALEQLGAAHELFEDDL